MAYAQTASLSHDTATAAYVPVPVVIDGLPKAAGVTMAALKVALSEYFSPVEVDQCAVSACADDAALKLGADVALIQALTRHALVSAHSGTVNADVLARCLVPFTLALESARGVSKTRAQFRATGLANMILAIAKNKNTLRNCTLDTASAYAEAFEVEAASALQYIKPVAETKEKAPTKSATAKIIAAIQAGTFNAADIAAIKKALANCKPVEPALL